MVVLVVVKEMLACRTLAKFGHTTIWLTKILNFTVIAMPYQRIARLAHALR